MVKWIDDEHPEGEMSDNKFAAQVGLIALARRRRFGSYSGNDGHIRVFKRHYRYKGVPYSLAIQRYFYFSDDPLGHLRLLSSPIKSQPERWVVLEHPEGLPLPPSGLLWADTLFGTRRTLREQWNRLKMAAAEDIEGLSPGEWLRIQAWRYAKKEKKHAKDKRDVRATR